MKEEQVYYNPVFVKTKNVRNFEVMMDALALNEDEGCFGMVYGQAGRGKTRTCQWYGAHNDCVYLRVLQIWCHSELEFLRGFCKAAGIIEPPARKGPLFQAVIDKMIEDPKPVFIDEPEKLPMKFSEILRDMTEVAGMTIVVVGEEELVPFMKQVRKTWSRTFRQLEFQPIDIPDIILYAKESTGLKLSIDVASILLKASDGDWRPVKRAILNMVQYANANETREISEKATRLILKSALTGN